MSVTTARWIHRSSAAPEVFKEGTNKTSCTVAYDMVLPPLGSHDYGRLLSAIALAS
jgi:hypothetical protein